MNLRLFSIAVLVSALPLHAFAERPITLNKGDFIAAERVTKDGGTLVRVRLSKSGKAKFKKLNSSSVSKEVFAEVGGVSSQFKLREAIRGESLEMGPYSPEEGKTVVREINRK